MAGACIHLLRAATRVIVDGLNLSVARNQQGRGQRRLAGHPSISWGAIVKPRQFVYDRVKAWYQWRNRGDAG